MARNNNYGIKSNTHDGKHVVFVDADIPIHAYPIFLETLKDMQHDYRLSKFYVFSTKHGFNAICLDKLELELITNMLYNYEIIDELFIFFNDYRGYYTLKFNGDKKFVNMVPSDNYFYEKSHAHKLFLMEILGIPIVDYVDYDTNFKFDIINY